MFALHCCSTVCGAAQKLQSATARSQVTLGSWLQRPGTERSLDTSLFMQQWISLSLNTKDFINTSVHSLSALHSYSKYSSDCLSLCVSLVLWDNRFPAPPVIISYIHPSGTHTPKHCGSDSADTEGAIHITTVFSELGDEYSCSIFLGNVQLFAFQKVRQ